MCMWIIRELSFHQSPCSCTTHDESVLTVPVRTIFIMSSLIPFYVDYIYLVFHFNSDFCYLSGDILVDFCQLGLSLTR